MTLVFLAPRITRAFRRDARSLDHHWTQTEPGVHQLQSADASSFFATWLIETNVTHPGEELREPILTLLSPRFLERRHQVFTQLFHGGWTDLVYYAIQQIQQLSMRDDFRQRYKDTNLMKTTAEEAMALFAKELTAEEFLKHHSASEILKQIPPQQILETMSPQQILEGISEENGPNWRNSHKNGKRKPRQKNVSKTARKKKSR